MVEAILQYAVHYPRAKILVSAPSNAAADVLLHRLAAARNHVIAAGAAVAAGESEFLSPREMFRFNSYQRECDASDVVLNDYSKYDNSVGAFLFPKTLQEFQSYRIVVCTCAMAGKLTNYKVPKGKKNAQILVLILLLHFKLVSLSMHIKY
jgi:hypothetical protein